MMKFIEIEVTYPSPDICCYKEYIGKPYYSIKYEENGEFFVGFGTYNPKVLSRYIKEYFMEAESPLPKPTDPAPIRDVYYAMTKCDFETGTVTYELRERSENDADK